MVLSSSRLVEFSSDVASGDVVRVAGGVIVAVQGSVSRGGEGAEVFNVASEGADGAQVKVPGHTVSEGFPTGTVLLVVVSQGHVGPLLHIMQRAGNGRDALNEGTAEGGVSY